MRQAATDSSTEAANALLTENPNGARRENLWWTVAFCGMCIGWGVLSWVTLQGVERRVAVVVLVAALLVSSFTLGRRAAWSGSTRHSTEYLVGLIPLLAATMAIAPHGGLMLIIGYPLVWRNAPSTRAGVLWNIVFAAACFGGMLAHGVSDAAGTIVAMAAGLTFSLAMGAWFAPVFYRSQERAELIRQLEDAQAQLAQANREDGVFAERERMAREIHDTLAQGFLSIVMMSRSGAAEVLAPSSLESETSAARKAGSEEADGPPGLAQFLMIEAAAQENLAEARALVAGFSPVPLNESGLAAALDRLSSRFTVETGLPVRLDLGANPAVAVDGVSQETAVVVIRAMQEALTNVRKHARASTVEIALRRTDDGAIHIVVTDDGIGFNMDGSNESGMTRSGFGMTGMEDRVALVGGTVAVEIPPEGGTRIRIALPTIEGTGGIA